ncbi:MAG TPA: VacJ family lipoprotein [Myxococcota bacterium]|nr:VacJ family lipoprotein [Myxococcota bacterium]
MKRGVRAALGALALAGLGCASTPDPWEGMNRGTFWFNERVDRAVLEPVATGWDWILPERVQTSVSNFFDNLFVPIVFVNDLFQAKPVAASQDVGRFVVNTTAGVAGFFDVASRIGIPENDEDFGQTFGRWGCPPGPYLVLPLLGPSSVRDAFGRVGDSASTIYGYFVPWAVTAGLTTVDTVNVRAALLEEIRQDREESLDFYVFVRNAYLENREHRVRDRVVPSDEDDLYYIEDEEEDQP